MKLSTKYQKKILYTTLETHNGNLLFHNNIKIVKLKL